ARPEGKDRTQRQGSQRRKGERPRPAPEQAEPAVEAAPPPVEPPAFEEPTSPAHSRLGSEGLARLRARYSEMLTRIDERVPEPDRQAELQWLAERLNPDAWLTDDDVSAGLECYESTFASLRAAIPSGRA